MLMGLWEGGMVIQGVRFAYRTGPGFGAEAAALFRRQVSTFGSNLLEMTDCTSQSSLGPRRVRLQSTSALRRSSILV